MMNSIVLGLGGQIRAKCKIHVELHACLPILRFLTCHVMVHEAEIYLQFRCCWGGVGATLRM